MLRALPVALAALLTACAAPPADDLPTPATLAPQTATVPLPADCPDPVTVRRLSQATAGLLYVSETDAPFTFLWYPAQPLPDAARMADLAGIPADVAEVETRDATAFFTHLPTVYDRRDPAAVRAAARYRQLEATLRARYSALAVYRVRDRVTAPAVWHVFVLGTDACGTSGLETLAVET